MNQKDNRIYRRMVPAPRFLVEYLKLEVMDTLWGLYHCVYPLGPVKAWEMRTAQRKRFEAAIDEELARVGLSMSSKEVKSAWKEYVAALAWTTPPKAPRKHRSEPGGSPAPLSRGNAPKRRQ